MRVPFFALLLSIAPMSIALIRAVSVSVAAGDLVYNRARVVADERTRRPLS